MKLQITERADRVLVKVDALVADTVHVEVPKREVDLSPKDARKLAKMLRRSASAAEAAAENNATEDLIGAAGEAF